MGWNPQYPNKLRTTPFYLDPVPNKFETYRLKNRLEDKNGLSPRYVFKGINSPEMVEIRLQDLTQLNLNQIIPENDPRFHKHKGKNFYWKNDKVVNWDAQKSCYYLVA